MKMLETNQTLISTQDDDTVYFLDEHDDLEQTEQDLGKWKILIVDDEPEVHKLTKMVLTNFEFEGKSLEFISVYSGQEAKRVMQEVADIALVLLDVVMERDDSGLRVVQYIREQLHNSLVRIVLRTGQPGQAPEQRVIMDYDINDYKEKTELTMTKLFTTVVSSLRAYRDLKMIESNRKGLEEIIKVSPVLFEPRTAKNLVANVLPPLASILQLEKNRSVLKQSLTSFIALKNEQQITILAGTGRFNQKENKEIAEVVSANIRNDVQEVFEIKKSKCFGSHLICYLANHTGKEHIIYIERGRGLSDWEKYLLEVYSSNVSAALENACLNEEIDSTQKEIILMLGELVESRSNETGTHLKRVAAYTKHLATLYGLEEEEVNLMYMASPMHDLGKIAIPDSILNKNGKLSAEEFKQMKAHTNLGYEMLKHSERPLMKTAAIICLQHHEKYDGTGYPYGLKGEEIHIYGRITALADVFDALSMNRVYKPAWPLEDIIEFIERERGKHFDPVLVDLFIDNLDDFLRIKDQYSSD